MQVRILQQENAASERKLALCGTAKKRGGSELKKWTLAHGMIKSTDLPQTPVSPTRIIEYILYHISI